MNEVTNDADEVIDDGLSDLQRLMSKAAEDFTPDSVNKIVKILRERRNLYAIEEAEKATKPKREPKEPKEPKAAKPKTPVKPKTETEKAAAELSNQLSMDDLGDLGLL